MTTRDKASPPGGNGQRRIFWETEMAEGRVRPLPPRFHWTADGRRIRLRPD